MNSYSSSRSSFRERQTDRQNESERHMEEERDRETERIINLILIVGGKEHTQIPE